METHSSQRPVVFGTTPVVSGFAGGLLAEHAFHHSQPHTLQNWAEFGCDLHPCHCSGVDHQLAGHGVVIQLERAPDGHRATKRCL